jgi:phosphate transport system permease protein
LLRIGVGVSMLGALAMLTMLVGGSLVFFRRVSWLEFLLGTQWSPLLEPHRFGVLPLVWGTSLVVLVALGVAVPLGMGSAIYLSEIAPERLRLMLKPALEVLAGIPTVVYGYFALTMVTPVLTTLFPSTQPLNAASAGIVGGIMILPTIASLGDDALRSVPDSLRQAAYALGATPMETTLHVTLPAAISGIVASFFLAIARAMAETMIVVLAAGFVPRFTLNPLEEVQTLTAYIGQVALGNVTVDSVGHHAIYAVAAVLFVMTVGVHALGRAVLAHFRRSAP